MKKIFLFLLFAVGLNAQTALVKLQWTPYDNSLNVNRLPAESFAIFDSLTQTKVVSFTIYDDEFNDSWTWFTVDLDTTIKQYAYYMIAYSSNGRESEKSNICHIPNPLLDNETIDSPVAPSGLTGEIVGVNNTIIFIIEMKEQGGKITKDFTMKLTGNASIIDYFILDAGQGYIDWLTGEPDLGVNNDNVQYKRFKIDYFRGKWDGNFNGNYTPDIELYSKSGKGFESFWTWDGRTFKKIFVMQ